MAPVGSHTAEVTEGMPPLVNDWAEMPTISSLFVSVEGMIWETLTVPPTPDPKFDVETTKRFLQTLGPTDCAEVPR